MWQPAAQKAQAVLLIEPSGDSLTYKDIFRYAAKHGLISIEHSERWLNYRDHRNDTAHLYGKDFAEKTLPLLPQFAEDARDVARVISEGTDG